MRLSSAVVVMPWGIGTLLELVFSWQLLQVGHLSERPIILIGQSFWSGLIDWVKSQQIGHGLVSPGDLRWLSIVDNSDLAAEIIAVEHQKFRDRKLSQGI